MALGYIINGNSRESIFQCYHMYGFVVVRDLFSSVWHEEMLKIMRGCANEDYAAILNPDRLNFLLAQMLPRLYRECVCGKMKLSETVRVFDECVRRAGFMRSVMKHPMIVDIICMLQQREVVGLMSQMLFKEAKTRYALQGWNPHQDNAYPQTRHGAYITINIFLGDSDPDNGGMYVYPESHHEKLLPFIPTKSYREDAGMNPGNAVEVPSKYQKLDLRVKRGDILVMNGHLIHGSYPNTSETRSRPLYSVSYIPKGEKFIPGKNAQRMEIPLR